MLLNNGLVIPPYDQISWRLNGLDNNKPDYRRGNTLANADVEIAAVAAVNKLVLATRNTDDFQSYENLRLENWFE